MKISLNYYRVYTNLIFSTALVFTLSINNLIAQIDSIGVYRMSISGKTLDSIKKNTTGELLLQFETDHTKNYFSKATFYVKDSTTRKLDSFFQVSIEADTLIYLKSDTFFFSTLIKKFRDTTKSMDTTTIDTTKLYYFYPFIDSDKFVKYHLIKHDSLKVPSPIFEQLKNILKTKYIQVDLFIKLSSEGFLTPLQQNEILAANSSKNDFNPVPPKKIGN